ITNAHIEDLAVDRAKIKDAAIDSAKIDKLAVKTAHIEDLAVTSAKIVSVSADKISAGEINTAVVTLGGLNGHLVIRNNRLQVFDNNEIPLERVSIGDVDGDGSIYGFRVRGEDGTTVLYDHLGIYEEGITD